MAFAEDMAEWQSEVESSIYGEEETTEAAEADEGE